MNKFIQFCFVLCLWSSLICDAGKVGSARDKYIKVQKKHGDIDTMSPSQVYELLVEFEVSKDLAQLFMKANVNGRALLGLDKAMLESIGVTSLVAQADILGFVNIIEHVEKEEDHVERSAKWEIFWAFIFPPFSIACRFGYVSWNLVLNIILTLLSFIFQAGHLLGVAHALYWAFK